jgi:hypothetical protein
MNPGVNNAGAADGTVQESPQQPAHQGNGGNFFTHLLPTAGGILGGIVGIPGDLISGGAASVAGAGAGSALGKGIENAIEGKNPLSASDLTSGAEGAIGQGVGGLIGKGLGAGAKLLASRAGGITDAAKAAADTAGVDKAALDTANSLKNNYAGVSRKMQGGDQLALGTNQKLLEGLGYDKTDPYQMRQASLAGNDPNDPNTLSLNKVYDEALQKSAPVDMSDFSNQVYKTMQNTGTTDLSSSPLGKALTDFNTRTGGTYGTDTGVELPKDMSAVDVRKLQQAVGKEMSNQQTIINNAENNGITNSEAEAAHSTLSNLYDQLGSKIKTPEVDAAVSGRTTTPEERQALIGKFGQQHGNQIADTIDQAKGAQDLLTPMKSYTQMGKASDMAIDNIENVTASPEHVARTKMDLNGDGTADVPPAGVNPLQVASDAHNANGVIGTALAVGKHAANNPTLLNTLSRVGALTGKIAPAAGVTAATAAGMGAAPVAATQEQGGTMGAAMQPQQNPLDQLYASLLAQEQAAPTVLGPQLASALSGLAPQVQKQNLVAGELSAIPGQFANAGGAQGTGGILSRISGLIPGTAANNYQNDQAGAAQALASQLGISPQAAMGLLPQLMNNQATAGQNQGVLSQLTGQLAY